MKTEKLKKQLKLYDIFAISTGAMFSSGFFLLPGIAAAETGASVYLAYLVSGILIVPAMLSVAELSTAMPKAGGAYYFLDRSLGPLVGTIGGLGSWIALMFKSSFALIGMGAYLSLYVDVSFTVLAIVLTIVFGVLNIFGAKETTALQRILVTVLVVIMAVFVIQGLTVLSGLNFIEQPEDYKSFFRNDLHGFISTVGLVFVSYAGLTKVTSVAEEVQNPDKSIPLGMMLSLLVAVVIYVSGVYIMLNVLSPSEFYTSLTPVADAGAKFMGWLPGNWGVIAIVVAAVAAFASTGNAGILSASRYPFAMARDKLVDPRFGRVGKTGTPAFSILVTVSVMILILLLFDVEAVAKLASAFQLLIFGFLCLAVIVMRESNIKSYLPGFRSPFYPWVQIAGMLISVWLISEMGILAVSLSGAIIALCVVWYFHYTKGKLERKGAIFHVHERLGRQRYEGLEHELLDIINEKKSGKDLTYEAVIARSLILETGSKLKDINSLFDKSAEIFAGRLKVEKKVLTEAYQDQFPNKFTKLGNRVIVCFFNIEHISSAEMVIYRAKEAMDINIPGIESRAHAIIFLVSPEDKYGLDMRLVGHLAEIVQSENFLPRWLEAASKKELREILLRDEHFAHISVSDNTFFAPQAGKKIKELELPESCLLAIIYRNRQIVIPHGNTELHGDDELSIIGNPEDIQWLLGKNQKAIAKS